MTILRIAVEDDQANALKHLLENVAFVKEVKEESVIPHTKDTLISRVKEILSVTNGEDVFKDIADPAEWQRKLRKDWERDI
jgi:hypothetical protein